jgi:two-component system OmpR family response regulator
MIQTVEAETAVNKSVLLVEDDPAVCYFLARVLRRAGYGVGLAADGYSGLKIFRSGSWDVVIADRMMPHLNGEQLAVEIKKQAPDTPVILITGFPHRVERPELFDGIFGKPFAIADLLACVSRLVPV